MINGIEADWVRIGVDVGQFVATGAVGIYVWLSDRAKARASVLREMERDIDGRLDGIGQRLARIETQTQANDPGRCAQQVSRIATLEEQARHAPNKGDLERAHARMDVIAEGLAELRGGIVRIEHQLNMLSEHLLNHPRARTQRA